MTGAVTTKDENGRQLGYRALRVRQQEVAVIQWCLVARKGV